MWVGRSRSGGRQRRRGGWQEEKVCSPLNVADVNEVGLEGCEGCGGGEGGESHLERVVEWWWMEEEKKVRRPWSRKTLGILRLAAKGESGAES